MHMKQFNSITAKIFMVLGIGLAFAFTGATGAVKYKCMVQMINYTGEKAYIAVSLINPKGEYEKTLHVHGDDDEWFSDIKSWWEFAKDSNEDIDGLAGASIGNGERQILVFDVDETKIDAGYKIRFESAVENQEYYKTDAEVVLNSATLKDKVEGVGYIRYVRLVPN